MRSVLICFFLCFSRSMGATTKSTKSTMPVRTTETTSSTSDLSPEMKKKLDRFFNVETTWLQDSKKRCVFFIVIKTNPEGTKGKYHSSFIRSLPLVKSSDKEDESKIIDISPLREWIESFISDPKYVILYYNSVDYLKFAKLSKKNMYLKVPEVLLSKAEQYKAKLDIKQISQLFTCKDQTMAVLHFNFIFCFYDIGISYEFFGEEEKKQFIASLTAAIRWADWNAFMKRNLIPLSVGALLIVAGAIGGILFLLRGEKEEEEDQELEESNRPA